MQPQLRNSQSNKDHWIQLVLTSKSLDDVPDEIYTNLVFLRKLATRANLMHSEVASEQASVVPTLARPGGELVTALPCFAWSSGG